MRLEESLGVLEKDTDSEAAGRAYWWAVYDFLKEKGFGVEWDEHLYIYDVPWDYWPTSEEFRGKKGKHPETELIAKKVKKLLTSKEFSAYFNDFLNKLKRDALALTFDDMKSVHGEYDDV